MIDYKEKAKQIRAELLAMIYHAKTGHTGGALSSVDLLVSLYYDVLNVKAEDPKWEDRDRFIMSKGHSVEGLLCVLADKGFFPKEELKTFSQYGSRLIGHPTNKVPGTEICSGALGHGLSAGVGMALGAKRTGKTWKTYVLMGDGELAEGSIWEAAMAAAHYKLDNLVAIIDRNHLQISGNTEEVMALENLQEKWEAFGWEVRQCDGHDIDALIKNMKETPWKEGNPQLMIANTVKGKGVSFMENQQKWHHGVPNEEQYRTALQELGAEEVAL